MKTGIWLDSREAFIIRVDSEQSTIEVVESDIEDFHPIGGSRSNVPYGPVDTVSEHKYQERRRHQEVKYFDEIIKMLKGESEILIFGPAQSKSKLSNRILSNKNSGLKIMSCLQADSMTDNQKIEFVKNYFGLTTRKTS